MRKEIMLRRIVVGALLTTFVFTVCAASPATAAGGGAPKVRVVGTPVTQENSFAVVDVRYRCASRTTATMYVSVRQGSVSDPSAFFDTSDSPPVQLMCDGDKHFTAVGVYALGSTESDSGLYGYLQDTAGTGLRAMVTAVVTDATTGKTDTDVDRVDVQSR